MPNARIAALRRSGLDWSRPVCSGHFGGLGCRWKDRRRRLAHPVGRGAQFCRLRGGRCDPVSISSLCGYLDVVGSQLSFRCTDFPRDAATASTMPSCRPRRQVASRDEYNLSRRRGTPMPPCLAATTSGSGRGGQHRIGARQRIRNHV
jgi:hypothetical protein